MKTGRVFITGLLISFLGTLPLGTLNIAAMQIAAEDGIAEALYFSAGALLVEMIYVRISLVAMDWVRKRKQWFRALEWLSVILVSALAIGSFTVAAQPAGGKHIILGSALPKFLLGVSLSAVNPLQIPFWFGWSTVLLSKNILQPVSRDYNIYISGIGTGTFLGNAVFIFGGRWMVSRLGSHPQMLNGITGLIFALTAILMSWKMLNRKEGLDKMANDPSSPNRSGFGGH